MWRRRPLIQLIGRVRQGGLLIACLSSALLITTARAFQSSPHHLPRNAFRPSICSIKKQLPSLAMNEETAAASAPGAGAVTSRRAALQPWLQEAMGVFLAGPRAGEDCVVSVGNDAGDLDSVVSAIALSYWLDTPGLRYLPVASFPRQDFKLRQDATLLFAHSGLPCGTDDAAPTNLLHWGELTPEALGRWPGIGVALTDHNKVAVEVSGTLGAGAKVTAVVDHHNDERAASTLSSPLRVIDAAAGSTCSLLAELMPIEV